MRVQATNTKQKYFTPSLFFFLFFFLTIPFNSLKAQGGCGSGQCDVCNATAQITSINNATIDVGSSTLIGPVNPGEIEFSDTDLEVTATGCGIVSLTVEVSFTWWVGTTNSWLHGISFDNSPGWLAAQGNNPGAGWLFEGGVTGICSGNTYGAGFYWDPPTVEGSDFFLGSCDMFSQGLGIDIQNDPSDNYGINPSACCPSFSFALEFCPSSNATTTESITFSLTEDGETGGWFNNNNCVFGLGYAVIVNSGGTDLPESGVVGPVCPGDNVILDAGFGCNNYDWSNGENGSQILVNPTMAQTYCVTASSGVGCQTVACVDVLIDPNCCAADAGMVMIPNPAPCTGEAIAASTTGFNADPNYSQVMMLVDDNGIIVEVIFGSSGSFTGLANPGDYSIYSYNYDNANGCGLPIAGFNIAGIDCSFGCGMLSSTPFVVQQCCDAMAGSISANLSGDCPGTASISASASGSSTNPANMQTIILVDPNGIIEAVDFASSASFTPAIPSGLACPFEFQVCSYNFASGSVDPIAGNAFTSIDCSVGCCEIECTTVSINDGEVPLLLNQPGNLLGICFADVPPAEALMWTDNCDGSGSTPAVEMGSADCAGGNITRTWEYMDACGNLTSHSQLIQVVADTDPPMFDNLPPAMSVACVADIPPPPGPLTWVDNCGETGTAIMMESSTVNGCLGGTVTRTWNATDACMNMNQHIQVILVAAAPAAILQNPPSDMTLGCGDPLPGPPADLTYTNNLSGICQDMGTIIGTQMDNTNGCLGGTIINTWMGQDACGNDLMHTQTFTIPASPPAMIINSPGDMTLTCGEPILPPADLTYDNNDATCPSTGVLTGNQVNNVNGCMGGTVINTWMGQDACGNDLMHTQTLTVEPTPAAMIQNPPGDMTLGCGDPIPPISDLTYDNGDPSCANSGTLTGNQVNNVNGCMGGTVVNTWTGQDMCGNDLMHMQTLTVEPTPAAMIQNPPGDMTLGCGDPIPPISDLTYDNGDPSCANSGTLTGNQVNNVNGCMGGTVVNTWTGQDMCGNDLMHMQTLTIEPTPAAMIQNPPGDMTLGCGDPIPPISDLTYDNGDPSCANSGTLTGNQVNNVNGCMGGTVVNTWTGQDMCGNDLMHTQTLTVEPTPAAMIQNPPGDMTLGCGDPIPPISDLTYDNGDPSCANSGTLTGNQVNNVNGCMGGTVVNTWTGQDMCGNDLMHTQTLTVEPTPAAMIQNPPGDMTLGCGDPIPPISDLTYDNGDPSCANSGTLTGNQVNNVNGCMGGTVVNTWTGQDMCGNDLMHMQTLTVEPTPAAMIQNPPGDMTLGCGDPIPPISDLTYDNGDPSCANSGTLTGNQVNNVNGCMGGTVVNTWTGQDMCGNDLMHMQTLTVEPTPAAMIQNPPGDMTLGCGDPIPPISDLTYDNGDPSCANSGTLTGNQVNNVNGCMGGTVVNTWTGQDMCGNDLMHTQTLTIPAVPIATFQNPPQNTTIACSDPLPPLNDLTYDNGDASCPNMGMISGTIQDNSDPCTGGTVVYTWSGMDMCDNPLMHTQTITITPPLTAMIQNPPSDMTIDCGDPLPPQTDLTFDNGVTGTCANTGTIAISVADNSDACGGSIVYTWSGMDNCGNSLMHTQTIMVNPGPAGTLQNPPMDMTITCGDPLPPLSDLTYDNGLTGTCQNTGTITGTSQDNSDACGGTIIYTWSGVDACGNPLNHTQTISVNPGPAATLQNPPSDMTIDCGDPLPPLSDLTYDNGLTGGCANTGMISGSMQDNSDPCLGGNIVYTWSGMDFCDNPLMHTQTININPAPIATLENPPSDMTIDCGDPLPALSDLTYSNGLAGGCANTGTIAGSITDNSDACLGGSIIYNWTGQDDCGNPLMHTQTITINPAPLPTLQNLPTDMNLSCGDALPALTDLMFDNGLTGGCANSGNISGNQSGSVDPCTGGSIVYTWTGQDNCGNPLMHTQTFTFSPAPIATFTSMPTDVNLNCGDVIPQLMDLTYDNGLTGGCQNTGTITGAESGSIDACVGGTIVYTWDGQDQCGNPLMHTQTITVAPAAIADFVSTPADVMINCGDALPPLSDLQYDNGATGVCQNAGTISGSMQDNSDACNGGTIVYTWDGQDNCGNPLMHTQTITVAPAALPTIQNPPSDIAINCGDALPSLDPLTFDNGLAGTCSNTGTISGSMQDNSDGCNGGTIIYTWDGQDNCGNPLMYTQTITVAPAPIASLVNPPANTAINCGDPLPPLDDILFDNNLTGICANAGSIQGTSQDNSDACGGTIVYTWDGQDACGNPLSHIQTITVNPAPPAAFLNPPTDLVINCGDVLPTGVDLSYDNGLIGTCSNSGTISPIVNDMSDPCTGGIITYTWSGMDMCNNPLMHVQTITMTPAPAASYTNLPADVVIDCGDPLPPLDPLTFDNNQTGFCANAGSVMGVMQDNSDACGGMITYTWSGMDNCGNALNHVQTITVNPGPAATFNNPPNDVLIDCGDPLPSLDPLDFDNGLGGTCANTGSIPGTMNDLSDACNGGIITYVWSGMDLCGNPLNHIQTITVNPAPIASLQNLPSDVVIECGDPLPSLDPLTYDNGLTGNCQITGTIPGSMNDMSDPCVGGSIIYTWSGVDICGNPLMHMQTITVNPAPIPTLQNAPTDVSIICGEPLPPLTPLTYDNGLAGSCQITGTIMGSIDDQSDPCTGGMITYMWTGVDQCGNPLEHMQVITLSPPPAAMLTSMPLDMTLQCGDPIPPLMDLTYDNGEVGICQITGSVPGLQTGFVDPCAGGILTYTWSAIDACGNSYDHVQVITVEAPAMAVLDNMPMDLSLNCGDPIPPLIDLSYDNGQIGQCQNAGTIGGIQTGFVDACVGGVLTYIWSGQDNCGNLLEHTQVITVAPAPMADFVNLPLDIELNCGDPFPPLGDLIYDNGLSGQCQITGSISGLQIGVLDPCTGGVIQYLWDGIDQCGNPISHTQNITVNPTSAGDFLFPPADITIACGDPIPPLTDLQYDNGIPGQCQNTGFISGVEQQNLDACFGGSVIYSWDGVDNCGNLLSYTQTITIQPASLPSFVGLIPLDMTIECGDPMPPLDDLQYDNGEQGLCQIAGFIQGVENGFADPCTGGIISYEWDGVDMCGNPFIHIQLITVNPPPVPQFLFTPPDITVECTGVPPMEPLQYDNGAFGLCNISGIVDGIEIDDYGQCPRTIQRIWEYNDPCTGQTIVAQQNVLVDDPLAPILDSAPADMTICEGEIPEPQELFWTDNCDGFGTVQPDIFPQGDDLLVTWTVIDLCGNLAVAEQLISVAGSSEVQIDGPTVICEGNEQGIPLCAQGDYISYLWNTGEFTECIVPELGGVYTVEAVDPNGCIAFGEFTLQANPAPEPVITGDLAICSGESTTLMGSGSVNYFWTGNVTGENLVVSSPGTYCLTVVDGIGCSAETCVEVSEDIAPTIDITGDANICEGATATVTASGGGTYLWNTNETSPVIEITTSQIVTVTVTNAGGCTSEESFEVTMNPNPIPIIEGTLAICSGESTTLNLSQDYDDIIWSTSDTGMSTTVSMGQTVSVTVTQNGCTGEAQVNVEETQNPAPTITGSTTFCSGTSTSLDAGNYSSYVWSPGGETSQTISVNTDGQYCVTVTDMNGCTGEICEVVTESTSLEPNLSGEDFCEGGNTTVDAGAGFATYLWSNNNETTQTISVNTAGTYTVTVSDGAGCTGTGSITINEIANPVVDLGDNQQLCEGGNTTLDAGGDANSTYLWSDNSINSTLNVTQTGTYSVTCTNSNGCTGTDEVMITIDVLAPPTITGDLDICTGETTVLDGGSGYTSYTWTPGNIMSQTLEVTTGGQYTLVVTGAGGCSSMSSVIVTETLIPLPSISGDLEICAGEQTNLSVADNYDTYMWTPGSGTTATIPAEAGSYSVVVSLNGCTATASATVIETVSPSPTITGATEICIGASTVLDAGNGYNSYQWSNLATSQTINVSAAGEYCVTVTDGSGCTGETCIAITEVASPEPTISGDDFCEGEDTTLDAGGPYSSYSWSSGGTSQTETINTTDTYIVTVTNAAGCEGTAQINVTENTPQQVSIAGSTTFCSGTSTPLTATGGTYVSYSWSTGETTSTINVNSSGTITVDVVDINGCASSASIEVEEASGLMPIVTGPDSFCQGESIELDAGSGFATYLWSSNTGSASTQTVSVSQAGTYSVTVSDGSSCTGIGSITVTQVAALNPTLNGDDFCEGETTTLSVNQTYTNYIWSDANASISPTLEVTEGGTYMVTVSDENGCTGVGTIDITEDLLPQPELGADQSICTGDNVVLNPGSFFSYSWTDPSGNTSNSSTLIASETGTYSVTVTQGSGCSAEDSMTLTVQENLVATIEGTAEFCQGNTTMLNVAEDFSTYVWSNTEETQAIEVSLPGNYSVTVTDASGCTGTASIAVLQNDNPSPSIAGSTTFCTGTSTTLDAGDSYTEYLWSSSETTQTIEVNTEGQYCVTVTDANGCTGETCVVVTESTSLEPNISGLDFCEGGATTLDAGAGFSTYLWSNDNETTQTITVDEGGIYSVTVTNLSGCTGEGSIEIMENPNPSVDLGAEQIICQGESTTLDAGAGFASYLWLPSGEVTQTIEVSTTGEQTVTVGTPAGCTASSTVQITVEDLPNPAIGGSTTFCTGTSTTLDAGAGYATYDWQPSGETTQTIEINTEGGVTVTVTNAAGCIGEASVNITESTSLMPVIIGDLDFCFGDNTTLDAGAGFATYAWSNSEMTQTIEVEEGGTYTVTVSDASGCTGTSSVEVIEGSEMNPEITGDLDFCDGETTTLDAGAGFNTYFWTTGETTQTIEVSGSAEWCVTVTNEIACTAVACVMTEENANPTPSITGPTTFCTGTSTMLDAGAGETYIWGDGETTQTIEVTEAGTYSVTVTDANGCTGTDEVTVTVSDQLEPLIVGDLLFCFGGSNVLTAGPGFETYTWSNGEEEQIITVDQGGDYTVTVSDATGCTGENTVTVVANPEIDLEITGEPEFCFGENTTLDAGTGYATYLWSNGESTPTITVSSSLDWCVTVSDAAGCVASDCFTTVQSEEVTAAISGSTTFCVGTSTTLTASGGETYVWSSGQTTAEIVVDMEGQYTVTVSNSIGCTDTEQIVVTESTSLQPNILGDDFCEGETTTLDAGAGFDTYLWSTMETTPTIEVDATGSYSVTVSDASGCTGENSIDITENENPVADLGSDASICSGESVILDAGTGSGGVTFDTYLWSNGVTTQTQDVTIPGIYCVTVTTSATCSSVSCLDVSVAQLPEPTISGSASFCTGLFSILDAGSYESYLWSTGETSQTIQVDVADTYSVTVTTTEGCTGETSLMVTESTSLEPNVIGDDFCDGQTATLDAGSGFASYIWSNGETTQLITVEDGGMYTVTVTGLSGCTGEGSLTISENENPTVDLGVNQNLCAGETTTLDAGSGFSTYTWSNGETTQTIEVAIGGNYTVEVEDSNGCTGSDVVEVTIADLPLPSITGSATFCTGTTTTLDAGTASGDTTFDTYLWSNGETTQTIIVDMEGQYTVTVTSTDGCTGEASQVVQESDSLEPIIGGTPEFCFNENTVLDAGAGFASYLWSNGEMTQTITVTDAGMYAVTVSDASACTGETSLEVIEGEELLPAITGVLEYCENETSTLDAGAGFDNYLWSNGANTQTIDVFGTSQWCVTVSDAIGCTAVACENTTEVSDPTPQINGSQTFCTGTSTTIDAGAGYDTYLWSNGETTQTITINMEDTYSVTVSNTTGCTGEDDFAVTESDSLEPNIGGDTDFCFDENTVLDAGAGFFDYIWSNGETTQTITVDASGIYAVTVSDASGCTGENSLEVEESTEVIPNISGTLEFCEGDNTTLDAGAGFTSYLWSSGETTQTINVSGTAQWCVTVSNAIGCTAAICENTNEVNNPTPTIAGSSTFCTGTSTTIDAGAGYDTYLWSNGETTQTITINTEDTYSVTVSNTTGCTGENAFAVTESDSLEPNIGGDTAFCFDENTILDAGSGFATYIWSNGETTQTISVDASGNYAVTVSDASGCSGETSLDVLESDELLPAITGIFDFCEGESSTLDAGAGFDSYLWSNGATTQTIQASATAQWCVTVSDAIGCTAVACENTTETSNPTPSIAGSDTFCTGTSTTLDAGSGYDTYTWSNGETTQTIVVNTADDYSVTVTNTEGCSGETALSVSESDQLNPNIGGVFLFCSGDATTLDGGSGFATYMWSNGETTQTIEVTTADTYSLTVTDASGCSGSTEEAVTEDTPPNAGIGSSDGQCENGTSAIDLVDLLSDADMGGVWSSDPTNPSLGGFDANNGTFDGTGLETGTYNFVYTVEATQACPEDTESVSITIAEEPTVMIDGITQLTCDDTTGDLTSTGSTTGGTYQWSTTDGGFESTDLTQATVTISAAGTYTLTIDVNGCSASESFEVTADENVPTASTDVSGLIDCENGQATLTVTTNITGGTYQWSGPNGFTSIEENPVVTEIGTYTVVVTNPVNNCSTSVDALVEADDDVPTVVIQAQPSVNLDCTIEAIILNAITDNPDDLTFQWYLNGVAIDKATDSQLEIFETGNYSVIASNTTSGCEGSDDQIINDDTVYPLVNIPDANMLTCVTTSVSITGEVSTINSTDLIYAWQDAQGNDLGDSETIAVTEPGWYYFSAEDVLVGCTNMDSVLVLENIELPNADAGMGSTIACDDTEAALDGSGSTDTGGGNNVSYAWDGPSIISGANTVNPSVAQGGTYTLTVTDGISECTAESSVDVLEPEMPMIDGVSSIDPGCDNTAGGSITIDNVLDGTAPFMYSINGEAFTSNNTFEFLAAGTYNIVVVDDLGCETETSVTLEDTGTVEVDLGADIVSTSPQTDLVAVTNIPEDQIAEIIWTPSTGLSCTDCLNPTATITSETTYEITIIGLNGCEDTDQITLRVEVEVNVYVPSAFSPDEDGINDVLTVFTSDQIARVQLFHVYDRWGNHIYEAYDFEPNRENFGWDGTYRGKEMDPAVFVWYAEVEMPSGRIELFKGDVTLMR